jgi:hypothetical protein
MIQGTTNAAVIPKIHLHTHARLKEFCPLVMSLGNWRMLKVKKEVRNESGS